MARDYDKELARAEAKVSRIKRDKAAAERRRYEPVGRAMYGQFGSELNELKTRKDMDAFCARLREAYDLAFGENGGEVPTDVSAQDGTASAAADAKTVSPEAFDNMVVDVEE